jgi:hypothetical protein
VLKRSIDNDGDNLHVSMTVHAEALARRYNVIVDDA